MANITFPAGPVVGQVYTFGSHAWAWDGARWVLQSSARLAGKNNFMAANSFQSSVYFAGAVEALNTITGSISGNAGTATKLLTARAINGVSFDGSADITVADGTKVSLTGAETISGVKNFTAQPTGIVKASVGLGNVDNTSDANKPVSTAQQTALDLKLDKSSLFSMRNKIINGRMDISQRGTSFPAIGAGVYCLDRWWFSASGISAVQTASQQADAPADGEFQNSLRMTVTTADTAIGATEHAAIVQFIEGWNVRDLIGRTCSLRFRVRSPKAGIHCIAFRNSTADRSFVVEYTVNAANTWETKVVTIPGGLITAGTWNWTTGIGLSVYFVQACGSTYQTAAGAWQVGGYLATANQVNCLDTVGNIFGITGVDLALGDGTAPFEHRPYGLEMMLCQRYLPSARGFDTANADIGVGGSSSTSGGVVSVPFPVEPRVPPTGITVSSVAHFGFTTMATNSAVTALTFGTSGYRSCRLSVTGTGTPYVANQPAFLFTQSASALLLFTGCEL